jgi:DNA-binding NtrC family response regulator
MRLSVIRLSAGLGSDGPQRLELGAGLAEALAAAKAEPGPVAFVVRDQDLSRFDDCRDLILDRGRKHPSKPLAPLLLGHDRIPLIRGGHTSPGQLQRSVRALLDRAVRNGDGNLFLVAAGATAFAALWARAAGPAGTLPGSAPAGPAARASERHRHALFELLPELPVPDTVRERFVGSSEEVRVVRQLTLRAAHTEQPVLILGDTGTGKEVVARLVHDQSPRRFQVFTPVNCGAIPRELLESELFGYEEGAHSTARTRKTGLWRMAHRGTLFLDEIADLSLEHQVKILRALEHGEIRPVGAERAIKVDARIVAATNRDIFDMVRNGVFREDLYYRLRSFMIRTPALRDHPEDIPLLARHFWRGITRDPAAELPADVLELLSHYRWPGNARELRMVLSTLFALFGTAGLGARQLRAVFEFEGQAGAESTLPPSSDELSLHRVECLRQLRRADEVLRAAHMAARPARGGRQAPDAAATEALEQRVNELELLCLRPLLFHGEQAFAQVEKAKAGLERFAAALRAGRPGTRALWRNDVEPALDAALSILFREVEKLLADTVRR